MRVNPNPMPDLLSALNQAQLESQQAQIEISSGRSVNEPSDNPAAAALLVENNDQATFNAGYLQSLDSVQGQLSTADSALSSFETEMQQAISLGVEGGNGTLSNSDRASIAIELQGIQTQLVSLANTSYQGNYVFAGTNTNTPPFVVDNTVPSGVSYVGNTDVNQVSIGSGHKLAVNLPGSQLFSASGNDAFLAINNLIQALQSNTGIAAAVTSLSGANNYLLGQRVFYGNAMNQAQAQTTNLNAAKLQISQQQNTLGGADLAAAASNLTQSQTDIQATLDTISKVSQQNSLFSYLT
jgi:flagellar hook-associated protein 3 FlgL